MRRRRLLAGREREIEEVDGYLRSSAVGRPVNVSLFGPPGSGKSSLLNAVVDLATERTLLAVRVEVNELAIESEVSFYAAVFEAAFAQLIDLGVTAPEAPLLRAWRRQTTLGDEGVSEDTQPFELGLLLAARTNGKNVSAVPTPLLRRDIERFAAVGRFSGIVLCLDGAEDLGHNREIPPGLIALANATPLLTIVTAGPTGGALQEAAPRGWAQVELGPFRSPGDVYDAIVRPLDSVERTDLSPELGMVIDVFALTGGQPYEVNLVCHFIWEAVQAGELQDLELSTTVIERVLAELEEKGRLQASTDVARIRGLLPSDLEVLADLVPNEAMTTRQIARLRLMLDDYDEQRLVDEEEVVRGELARLATEDVVLVESDRFSLSGGEDARLYLKYAVKRHTGRDVRYDESYERLLTLRVTDEIGRALQGEHYEQALLYAAGRPFELGNGSEAGQNLKSLCTAVHERNLVDLSELLPRPVELENMIPHRGSGGVVFGVVMQVGVHLVEHLELLSNVDGASSEELAERAQSWVQEHVELLAKYETQVLELRCEYVDPGLLAAVAAYSQLMLHSQLAVVLYQAGLAESAYDLVDRVVRAAQHLVGDDPMDALLRAEFADAFVRLGFMAASLEKWDEALSKLDASSKISLQSQWLVDYNRGYVLARLNKLAEAANATHAALEQIGEDQCSVILLSFMPVPDDWEPGSERWNVVGLAGGLVKEFVELQAAVLRAQEDSSQADALREIVDRLTPSAPIPVLRLAGWAAYTLLGTGERAIELFDAAAQQSRIADVQMARSEGEFVRGRWPGA